MEATEVFVFPFSRNLGSLFLGYHMCIFRVKSISDTFCKLLVKASEQRSNLTVFHGA